MMNEDFSEHASIIDRNDFIDPIFWDKIQEFIKDKNPPFLILSKEKAWENYKILKWLIKNIKIYYAVKACPNEEILKLFYELWSCFDIASTYELDSVLANWTTPDRISYWNTIKKEKDIEYAFNKWVRMFATDSFEDLEKIARAAPWSKVYFRLLTPCFGADWPLSRKFWCEIPMAYELAVKAKQLWLVPYWISFHVGSQQNDIYAWDVALSKAKELYDELAKVWIVFKMLNIWWGLPSNYIKKTDTLDNYIHKIQEFIDLHFWENDIDILMEPWRSMVWNIWVIISEIALISKKSIDDDIRWVFLDIWKFSWLIETLDEAIKYPIYTEVKWECTPVILAWPTCDSADILYENYKYLLPENLKSWDKVYIFSTWAYTQSYSAIEFNWFPPLKVYVI